MVKRQTYAGILNQPTPQTQQAHPEQVANSAGGWSFPVDHWTQLTRFLILGSEDGTYYIQPKELTLTNMRAVQKCLKEDGLRVVSEIRSVSWSGRAAKNSPAIFALALATSPQFADKATNREALNAIVDVCRTATMLFEFCEIIQRLNLRGWGRGLRTAVGGWFIGKDADQLAYQLVKYRQRDGWTARDVLRLAHPVPKNAEQAAALRWAIGGMEALGQREILRGKVDFKRVTKYPDVTENLPRVIKAYDLLQSLDNVAHVVSLIRDEKLPREALPTQWLNDPLVWAALLDDMPYTAMLRNLATMTRVGLLDVGYTDPAMKDVQKAAVRNVIDRLTDMDQIRRARVHPIAILAATKTYQQGHGIHGTKSWLPNPRIIDALNQAFRLAFVNVEPYDGRTVIAIDVSGSMQSTQVVGLDYLSCTEGAAALALPLLVAMPNAFTTAFNTDHQELTLTAGLSLEGAASMIQRKISGGTDCAAPIRWAQSRGRVLDLFVIITDSETWAGGQHPFEALREYREKVNPSARLAVVAMCANQFTLNAPEDVRSINLVGFDTNTGVILSAFARGEI